MAKCTTYEQLRDAADEFINAIEEYDAKHDLTCINVPGLIESLNDDMFEIEEDLENDDDEE